MINTLITAKATTPITEFTPDSVTRSVLAERVGVKLDIAVFVQGVRDFAEPAVLVFAKLKYPVGEYGFVQLYPYP